ncbi:MAG: TlpA family protein disulfide reductase [Saprospiraceae bacterium]|nr:TlpA family protein disulfide reductase [Saprospiraceae bacterium]
MIKINMKKNALTLTFSFLTVLAFSQKTMPNVSVKTLEGKTVNASELAQKGKVTIINFWATWCAPCQKELSNIAPKYADWQKKYNTELVAVTIDNAQGLPRVKPMVAQKKWKYTVISDVNSDLLRQLGGQNVPFTVVIDTKGNIVYTHNGYKQGDETELEKKIEALSKK